MESLTSMSELVCEHGPAETPFKIVVLGVECEFARSLWCPLCLQEYLNKFSTLCVYCGKPIFPREPVEGAGNGYAHIHCGNTAAAYVGTWGEGELIPHPALAERTRRN